MTKQTGNFEGELKRGTGFTFADSTDRRFAFVGIGSKPSITAVRDNGII